MKAKQVVIIDDDEDDRSIFMDAVKEISDQIVCVLFEDALQALSWLLQTETLPAVIFLDLNMPRMDGREFLIRIKKESRLRNIPVVIYSTSARREDILDAQELGAAHFLTKPVLYNEICASVRKILEQI